MKRIDLLLHLIFVLTLIPQKFLSAESFPGTVQLFEAVGKRAGSKLGYQVVGLGDQNSDGFDDIIASASGDREVFIFFGSNAMDTIPDLIFHENEEMYGGILSNLGDINGNNSIDFAIASNDYVRIFWGGTELDTIDDLILPSGRVCAAGDVNGDGYDDILYSSVDWQSYRGKVSIYLGGTELDSIADWSTVGDSAWYYFGDEIAGNGDMNGDGYDDISISGYRWLKNQAYCYIKVFFGGLEMDTIPDFDLSALAHQLDIGTRAIFTDVNKDGFSDLCVDSHLSTSALIFWGSTNPVRTPGLTLHGTSISGKIWVLSEAGDINCDGNPDIITGNYDGVGGLGEVLVFLGGPYMDGEWDVLFNGFQGPYEGAGRSVGRAGDVNGDGADDILFGSWREYGDNREGRVNIFSGDTTLTFVSPIYDEFRTPSSFSLKQNSPNPFNESTVIEYETVSTQPKRTVVKIHNILGQEVVTLVDDFQASGHYRTSWNGKDESGAGVGSGIYFCRLQVGNSSQFIKMLLLK